MQIMAIAVDLIVDMEVLIVLMVMDIQTITHTHHILLIVEEDMAAPMEDMAALMEDMAAHTIHMEDLMDPDIQDHIDIINSL